MATDKHKRWVPSHEYRPLESGAERQAWKVVALTGATMVVEIVAGYWFNSMALLADGWHMSSHMFAIGMTALAYFLARRYANDPRFAFGTWKIEVLAGFASSILLIIVVLMLALESLWRLLEPEPVQFGMALTIAVLGLLVNLVSAWLLRDPHDHGYAHGHSHDHAAGHSHHDHAHDANDTAQPAVAQGKDLNRHAAFIHVLADAVTSVAAILALLGGLLWGWYWLDPLMGIIGSVIIAIWAKGLLTETTKALLDREMDTPLVAQIRSKLEQQADTEIVDLHIWRVGRAQYAGIISVVTHSALTPDDYKAVLKAFTELVHVTVEVNRCLPATGGSA